VTRSGTWLRFAAVTSALILTASGCTSSGTAGGPAAGTAPAATSGAAAGTTSGTARPGAAASASGLPGAGTTGVGAAGAPAASGGPGASTPSPGFDPVTLDNCAGAGRYRVLGVGEDAVAVFGTGSRAVVFSDESDQSLCSWLPFAARLVRAGYRVALWDPAGTDEIAELSAIVAAVRMARAHERWAWFAVEGVLDLAVGAFSVVKPGVTAIAFTVLLGVWACVTGALLVVGALAAQRRDAQGWMAFAGAVSAVWGLVLLVWPGAGAIAIVIWLGAYALVFGIVMVITAVRMRRERRHAA